MMAMKKRSIVGLDVVPVAVGSERFALMNGEPAPAALDRGVD